MSTRKQSTATAKGNTDTSSSKRQKTSADKLKSAINKAPASVPVTHLLYSRGRMPSCAAAVHDRSIWAGGLIVEYADMNRPGRYHVLDIGDPVIAVSAIASYHRQCLVAQASGFITMIRAPSNGNPIKIADVFFSPYGVYSLMCNPRNEAQTYIGCHGEINEYDLEYRESTSYLKENKCVMTFSKHNSVLIATYERLRIWDIKAGQIGMSCDLPIKSQWNCATVHKTNTLFLGGDDGIWEMDIRKPTDVVQKWSDKPSQSLCITDKVKVSCDLRGNLYSYVEPGDYVRSELPSCSFVTKVDDVVVAVG